MSGGSYNYAFRTVQEMADNLSCSKDTYKKAFSEHLTKVAKAMKAVEWVDSGDWGVLDDKDFILDVIPNLDQECLEINCKRAEELIAELKENIQDIKDNE